MSAVNINKPNLNIHKESATTQQSSVRLGRSLGKIALSAIAIGLLSFPTTNVLAGTSIKLIRPDANRLVYRESSYFPYVLDANFPLDEYKAKFGDKDYHPMDSKFCDPEVAEKSRHGIARIPTKYYEPEACNDKNVFFRNNVKEFIENYKKDKREEKSEPTSKSTYDFKQSIATVAGIAKDIGTTIGRSISLSGLAKVVGAVAFSSLAVYVARNFLFN